MAGLILTVGATAMILVALPHALGGGGAAVALFGGLGAAVVGLFFLVGGLLGARWRERATVVGVRDGRVPLRQPLSGARVESTPGDAQWRVSLFADRRHPVAEVYLASREDADAFVASAVGIDGIVSFRLPVAGTLAGGVATLVLWTGLVAAGLLVLLTKVPAPLAMLVGLAGAILLFVPQRAEVGIDGMSLVWLGHRTLIPFATIESLRVERGVLFLQIHGRRRPLRIVSALRGDASGADSRDALVARIAAHRATADESLASLNAALSLSRSDHEAWGGRLRALARSGYRNLALSPAALSDVLQDPASSEDARVAAATLLRVAMDAKGLRRMRAVAASAVSPSLRAALETVEKDPDPLGLRSAG